SERPPPPGSGASPLVACAGADATSRGSLLGFDSTSMEELVQLKFCESARARTREVRRASVLRNEDRVGRRAGRRRSAQAAGGARARKGKCAVAARRSWSPASGRTWRGATTSGSAGAADGVAVAASWINPQIAQPGSVGPSDFGAGGPPAPAGN